MTQDTHARASIVQCALTTRPAAAAAAAAAEPKAVLWASTLPAGERSWPRLLKLRSSTRKRVRAPHLRACMRACVRACVRARERGTESERESARA